MPRHKFNRPEPPIVEVEPREKYPRVWPPAPSLKPGEHMIEACAAHDCEAQAIRDGWRSNHPIKVLSRQAYAELIARTEGVVYHGD